MKERAQSLLVPPAAPGYRQPVTFVMSSPNVSSGSSSWLPESKIICVSPHMYIFLLEAASTTHY